MGIRGLSRRYYLCPIISSVEGGQKINRCEINKYSDICNYVCEIPTFPNGDPIFNWTIVCVETNNHAPLLNDNQIISLPENLDFDSVISLSSTIEQYLTSRGVNLPQISERTIRRIVQSIGDRLHGNFKFDKFFVK